MKRRAQTRCSLVWRFVPVERCAFAARRRDYLDWIRRHPEVREQAEQHVTGHNPSADRALAASSRQRGRPNGFTEEGVQNG